MYHHPIPTVLMQNSLQKSMVKNVRSSLRIRSIMKVRNGRCFYHETDDFRRRCSGPSDNYLPRVREVCDKHGVLLILDEVVSGFGRTANSLVICNWGKDIITFARYFQRLPPMAATVVRENIFEAFYGEPGTLRHFRQINTYGGHPVARAVGLKNIEIIERESLTENARSVGSYLPSKLEGLLTHPYVGDVRGAVYCLV